MEKVVTQQSHSVQFKFSL